MNLSWDWIFSYYYFVVLFHTKEKSILFWRLDSFNHNLFFKMRENTTSFYVGSQFPEFEIKFSLSNIWEEKIWIQIK